MHHDLYVLARNPGDRVQLLLALRDTHDLYGTLLYTDAWSLFSSLNLSSGITIDGGGVVDGNAPYNDWHNGPSNRSADGKHVARGYADYWHMCRPRMVELRYVAPRHTRNIEHSCEQFH